MNIVEEKVPSVFIVLGVTSVCVKVFDVSDPCALYQSPSIFVPSGHVSPVRIIELLYRCMPSMRSPALSPVIFPV